MPTRDEYSRARIAADINNRVQAGELTEEEAAGQIDAINSGLDSMREIGQRVQSGELTEEEARKQVETIMKSMPEYKVNEIFKRIRTIFSFLGNNKRSY